MFNIFRGLFDSYTTNVIGVGEFLLCIGTSLLVGLLFALVFMRFNRYSKSYVLTLALLPAVVCVVIMIVNGNVGTGIAVAGAFGLVRYRSAPGTAKEIIMLFLATSAGLITGTGYLVYALLFTVLMCAVTALYCGLNFGGTKKTARFKLLHITIPEDLDYGGVFEQVLAEYTTACELICVKTTNMGSLFRLSYELTMKDPALEKEMIDALRCRNGNLEITVSNQQTVATGL